MGIIDRFFRRNAIKSNVSPTGAGYPLPVTGGWIPNNWPWNWWQQGRDPVRFGESSTVHACIDAYAQTIASLPGYHYELTGDGGRKALEKTPLAKFLRYPNSYQTRSDFMLNLVKQLLYNGNAYAIALRDNKGLIDSVHIVDSKSTMPYIEPETQMIFYGIGSNPLMPKDGLDVLVPFDDVLHIRLYTPHHPLIGVSPLRNLAASIASNNAILGHQATFFSNMSRPSGVLTTDEKLSRDQMLQLREAWEAQSQGINSGRIPILSSGLRWESMSINSQDSQLIDAYRMGVEEIARAFRVPLPLIGDNRNNTYNNVEQLVNTWLAMGLGFVLEHIERAFDKLFAIPANQHTNFDTDTLMRTDFKGRIEALAKAVTNGIYSPNEARMRERLPSVSFGDEPRVQAQNVPLSAAGKIPEAAPPAPAAPTPDLQDDEGDDEDMTEEDQKDIIDLIDHKVKRMIAA
jgi:HK97 family phage portal protein